MWLPQQHTDTVTGWIAEEMDAIAAASGANPFAWWMTTATEPPDAVRFVKYVRTYVRTYIFSAKPKFHFWDDVGNLASAGRQRYRYRYSVGTPKIGG